MAAASRNRPRSDTDRLVVARISGIALRHARWREPTEDEAAAAVAELREIAGDRPDLLAEQAGILLGFHEGGLDEPRANATASFCIAAGADQGLIPRWVKVGRERAELAGRRRWVGRVAVPVAVRPVPALQRHRTQRGQQRQAVRRVSPVQRQRVPPPPRSQDHPPRRCQPRRQGTGPQGCEVRAYSPARHGYTPNSGFTASCRAGPLASSLLACRAAGLTTWLPWIRGTNGREIHGSHLPAFVSCD